LRDVKEELVWCSIEQAQIEHARFRHLDVSQFRDPVSVQTLEWIASGKFFTGHEDFFAEWRTMFGDSTLYNFKLMARKARFSTVYPNPEQHDDLQALKQYERSKHAILCYTAAKQEQQGNRSIMTELAVDLLLESRTYDKDTAEKATLAELKRPHPVICIDIAKRLVSALGISSLFDFAHPVLRSDFSRDAVSAVLQEAQSHNLQRGRSGAPTLAWVNAVLCSTVCVQLELKQIKPEIWTLSIPDNIAPLLRGHTLLQRSWFEEKWGMEPPQLDQFRPCSTDTRAKLVAIQGVFKQSQDATSQAFVKQLDTMIHDRKNEDGRLERGFSFNHVQNIKQKFKIDAETVAARAAACFSTCKKRKTGEDLLEDEQLARAARNAAFAARFRLVSHSNIAEREAARRAIDSYLEQRLPEAPRVEVQASSCNPATRAEANAVYARRFREERTALRLMQVPQELAEAARHAIDTYLQQRLPAVHKIEVEASDIDPVTRAARQSAYSARFDEERAALLSIRLPPQEREAARRTIDTYHARVD
jgi:hypothetical protein